MSKQITIDSKTIGKTSNQKDMWTFTTTDGERYTLFEDTPIAVKTPFLKGRGAVIEIETVRKGEYDNITAAKFIRMDVLSSSKLTPEETKTLSVTLSYAVDLAVAGKIQVDEILSYATTYYRHITTMPEPLLKAIEAKKEGV